MNRRKRPANPLPPARRNLLLLALFGLGAIALEAKLAWLQVVKSDELTAEGQARQFRQVAIPVQRGVITDRNYQPLAISTPVDSIWVDPTQIAGDRESILQLARAMNINGEALEREITSNTDSEFLWVERGLSPSEAADILELGLTGVHTQGEYKRYWPMHEITCQLVGFTNIDDRGGQGLEYVFDADLTGTPGQKLVQKDLKGRLIADVEEISPARPGADVRLSIDMALQYPAYRALKTAMEETGARRASLVMLDAETGEVLVMANQPACNPNDSEQKRDLENFRNYAIRDMFEPGSSIKPLIVAAALDSGMPANTLIHIPPEGVKVGQQWLEKDDRADPNGDTLTNILSRSSNPGMVMVSRQLDAEVMWRTLKNFGLAGPTGSGLGRSEVPGQLDDYQLWGEARKDTVSYGYGLSLTTLQLARAYAAIASGGLLPPVSMLALNEPPRRERVISEQNAAALVQMLEAVVDGEQATAQLAAIPNYRVAGKTGTARMTVDGSYSSNHHRAIFAGFAPASHPRFVVVVVIEDPGNGDYYGGKIAAPVFAEVMSTALRHYGVPPDDLVEPQQLTTSLAEDRQ